MSSTPNNNRRPILEQAWLRHAELDQNAIQLNKRHQQLRWWVALFGVSATFLAIFIDNFADGRSPFEQLILKVMLIAMPLLASMIAAYTGRELGDGRWLAMRAGSEDIRKEIYIYRTVLQEHPDRDKWLSNRLATILRQVYKNCNNKLDTVPYTGDLPPISSITQPDSGFSNLSPDEYIQYRLQEQLTWHEKRIVHHSKAKRNLTIAILCMGALGALLAGLGGPFTVWVALTASITAALTGWEELKNREKVLLNYSKVKLELSIIRDFWHGLLPEEQTQSAFYRLVLATETLLLTQTTEWFHSMRQALAGIEDEDKKLVEEMVEIASSAHTELQKRLLVESQTAQAQQIERIGEIGDEVYTSVYADYRQAQSTFLDDEPDEQQTGAAYAPPSYTPYSNEATVEGAAWAPTSEAYSETAVGSWAAPAEELTPSANRSWQEEISDKVAWQGADEALLQLEVTAEDPLLLADDEIIKYATDFVPVETAVDVETAVVPEVAYQAEPDVKYAIEIVAEEGMDGDSETAVVEAFDEEAPPGIAPLG